RRHPARMHKTPRRSRRTPEHPRRPRGAVPCRLTPCPLERVGPTQLTDLAAQTCGTPPRPLRPSARLIRGCPARGAHVSSTKETVGGLNRGRFGCDPSLAPCAFWPVWPERSPGAGSLGRVWAGGDGEVLAQVLLGSVGELGDGQA